MSLTKADSPLVSVLDPSPNYDSPSGRRHGLFIVHDVESGLDQDFADVLASTAWFGSTKAGTSAHYMTGPDRIIQMVSESDRAWHIGGPGNLWADGSEQTGYASYTREQWTTADGLKQITLLGQLIADWAKRHGATASPVRASHDEIKAYANGADIGHKWCHHYDITQTGTSNTTHTDTGGSYPDDLLQQAIDSAWNGVTPQEDDELNDADWTKLQKMVDDAADTAVAKVIAGVKNKDVGDAIGVRVWNTHLTGTPDGLGAGGAVGILYNRKALTKADVVAAVKASVPGTSDASADQIADALVAKLAQKLDA